MSSTNSNGGQSLPEEARKLLREYIAIIDLILDSDQIREEEFGTELDRLEEIEQHLEADYEITFSEETEDD